MTLTRRYAVFASIVCLTLVLAACAPGAANESVIATSVALTVQAQDAETAAAVTPTPPPATRTATPFASPTGLSTKAPPTAPTGGSALCTADATFVSETIPDGAIMSPGSAFTKVWRIQNTGTCPWNKTWKLVYVSGDLMGAATVYDFPQIALPGDTVDVPIVLVAPLAGGAYRGNWKIQSPWGQIFGDSGSNPFWVDIVVGSGTPGNAKTATVFGITNVTYTIERRCTTANTFWHVYVNLTSNGPVDATFNVIQSDGNGQRKLKMSFTSATTQTYDYGEWGQRFTSSTNARWVQTTVTSPTYFVWPASAPFYLCGY
jgi:hypothetical protein